VCSSIPAESLPSFSEMECSSDRPYTPVSSIADDADWTDGSLEEMMSRLEKHTSHVGLCISQLSHDSSCSLRLLAIVGNFLLFLLLQLGRLDIT